MGEDLYPGSAVHVVDNGDEYLRITANGHSGEVYTSRAEWDALVELIQAGATASVGYQFTLVDNAPGGEPS